MNHQDLRRRAVGYLVLAALAGAAWWVVSRGAPLFASVRSVEARVAVLEATTRAAREQRVRSGDAGIEDSIAAARSRFDAVAELVPSAGTGESDADMRRLVGALAERNGVVVRSSEEAPAAREGPLLVSTLRISAEGRYHDVGRWLAAVESNRRLVRIGVAALGASPDTNGLVRAGSGSAAPAAGVRFEGTFLWFRRDSAAAAQDSTMEAN